jgi:signal transduction histidine kinase
VRLPAFDARQLAALTDPRLRREGSPELARWLGGEALLLFLRDPDLGAMLPAPGYPQTLRDAAAWREVTAPGGTGRGVVVSPFTGGRTPAVVRAAGDLQLVLLGGEPDGGCWDALAPHLPLVAQLLRTERALLGAEGQAASFREATARLKTLATSLDEATGLLEEAIRERDASLATLSTLNEVGPTLASELRLDALVQRVTDAATRLSGAEFGAFFYNVTDAQEEAYTLYCLSGVPREAFARFPMPRNTRVFGPTFRGEGTVRSDDIREDPRYGHNAPHRGMPAGHLPVVSYLAVPVVSRGGEVLGGLFFGHGKVGVFGAREQALVEGLASQAAIALDNARLYGRLQESVRARDEFLSIASHELRTPLTSLMLQNGLRARELARGGAARFTPERLARMVDDDRRQYERLTRLVDDMLDIARINSGKLELVPARFDLVELAAETCERYRPELLAAGCLLALEAAGPVEGSWDRFRVEQVLTNLLTNAARYGAGRPVRVRVWEDGGRAHLEVRDQGIGIAPEHHARIFQRFERAISANEVSGLGLGLYIVKQIVERHAGQVRVESAPGQGAAFTVVLPVGAAAPGA